LNDIAKDLKITTVNEWMKVKEKDISLSNSYASLLKKFGSLSNALAAGYPEFIQYHKRFFDEMAKELHIETPHGWYNVTVAEVKAKGGNDILQHHGGSLTKGTSSQSCYSDYAIALSLAYPQIDWSVSKMPTGFWKKLENQRKFLDQVAREMGIQTVQDWYHIKKEDIIERGGRGLLHHYKYSLAKGVTFLLHDDLSL
jgi:hypothetical protein